MNRRVVRHHAWWSGRCRDSVGPASGRCHPVPAAGSYSGPVATGGSMTGGPGPYGGRGNGLRVTRTVSIPWDEISWRATSPGGPGGQHANRRSTRVEVSVDVGRRRVARPAPAVEGHPPAGSGGEGRRRGAPVPGAQSGAGARETGSSDRRRPASTGTTRADRAVARRHGATAPGEA